MHINGKDGLSFFEQNGLIVRNITAIVVPENSFPEITLKAADTNFRADFAAAQVTLDGHQFDLRDGVRIEISRAYNGKLGAVRYSDGTIIPATVTKIEIAVDAATNTFSAKLTTVAPVI